MLNNKTKGRVLVAKRKHQITKSPNKNTDGESTNDKHNNVN